MNFAKLRSELKGKGLIAFSDPAGAKSCLALAWFLQQENPNQEVIVVSNKHYSFYSDWDIPVVLVANPDSIDFSAFDWIFTGTSHPDSSAKFEVNCIRNAQTKALRSYAFIDHWTNLALRFKDGEQIFYPETIFVLSELIKELAVNDGIPTEKLELLENPYLAYIKEHWKSQLRRTAFYEQYHIPTHKNHVLVYAPDPISLRFKNHPFDEASVCRELILFFQQHPDWFVVIKTHPLQDVAYLRQSIADLDHSFVVIDDQNKVENLEVMHHSSAILGFFSNFLMEASAMQKPVFRYISAEKDEFEPFFRNFSTTISSIEELTKLLNL